MMRSAVAALALSLALPALAAEVPKPDPRQGDGRVSAFYTWQGQIPEKPGQMLRTEPLDPLLGLPNAGMQARILYTSTDGIDGRTPVVVSGAYFAPKGTPPAGGWPLIAWAHGTTGVADICAPSWQTRSYRDLAYLEAWLAQGYAVVGTDYQGLGTPGPHPYLATRPEAYGVLDSIRAARAAWPDQVANRIVIVGQSQGGGAAFATAGLAAQYAPELGIRGTVATGVPYLNADSLRTPPPGDPTKVEPTIAYVLYVALFGEQIDLSFRAESVFTERAQPAVELARNTCVGSLFSDVSAAGLSRANAYAQAPKSLFATVGPYFAYATLKLPQPLFVGTGAEDHDVAPGRQLALVRDACAAGSTVEAHLYAGLNHGQTVNASLRDSLPFVRKVLAGEAITPVCEPQPE
jgi:pimeloyl-ACP methyl ester carboxylesterase